MLMNKHAATPWTVQTDGNGFFWIDKLTGDGGYTVCNCGDERDDLSEANATFIVQCCNSHDDLLAALRLCLPIMEAHTEASHLTDGFRPRINKNDRILTKVKAAIEKGGAK